MGALYCRLAETRDQHRRPRRQTIQANGQVQQRAEERVGETVAVPSLVPIAAGTANPIVPRPPELIQLAGNRCPRCASPNAAHPRSRIPLDTEGSPPRPAGWRRVGVAR